MPRLKTIDMERIGLEKVDMSTIKDKRCLQAELVFRDSLNDKQWHVLQSYYRFEIDKENNKVGVQTNNSWKGLVMALLSIAYVKHGAKISARLMDVGQYFTVTMVSTDYRQLQCETTYVDNRIEQVAAPPSWKACYVRGNYDFEHIVQSIKNLSKLLGLDTKQSCVRTEYALTLPYQYKYRPLVEMIDNTGRLCCYLSDKNNASHVGGIAVVSDKDFGTLFGNRQAKGFTIDIPPEKIGVLMEIYDDPMKPIPLYAYQIKPEHIPTLSSYFPYLRKALESSKKSQPPYDWIVFDRKHLGKWG